VRLLLDTHILLWSLIDPNRLPIAARDALAAPENSVFFSAASIWEIAIKRALNRPDFAVEPELTRDAALDTGFQELSVNGLHATKTRSLPHLHRDPFDRILIAQAQTEPLVLMTEDPQIARYDVGLWKLQ
jgi:PIN domain nuclease of toxin-antitoxin system